MIVLSLRQRIRNRILLAIASRLPLTTIAIAVSEHRLLLVDRGHYLHLEERPDPEEGHEWDCHRCSDRANDYAAASAALMRNDVEGCLREIENVLCETDYFNLRDLVARVERHYRGRQ